MARSILKAKDRELVPEVRLVTNFFSRLMGLMGRPGLPENEALLFSSCNSIHTCFMRFAIDVIFVSDKGVVVDVVPAMKPWRFLAPRRGAEHTIEMTAGRAESLGIRVGDQLQCKGAWT